EAAMRADEAKAKGAVTSASGTAESPEVVELSPFEVREANNGYYASTTMSGTRLNAKLEDLASSISVVTKQQMQDFALVDIDDIGGYRTSLDVNRPIIKGKLGLRGSVVYQHEEFRQKPSGTTSRRYNAMLRAQPFKETTIRAFFQHYELYGTRASAITPRDTV